jgi:hypothetical protein
VFGGAGDDDRLDPGDRRRGEVPAQTRAELDSFECEARPVRVLERAGDGGWVDATRMVSRREVEGRYTFGRGIGTTAQLDLWPGGCCERSVALCVGTAGREAGNWRLTEEGVVLETVKPRDGVRPLERLSLARDGERWALVDAAHVGVVAVVGPDGSNSYRQESEPDDWRRLFAAGPRDARAPPGSVERRDD